MATPNNTNFQAVKDAITESIRKDGYPTNLTSLIRSKTPSVDAYITWTQETLLQKTKSPRTKLPAADALAKIQSAATNFADLKAITALSDATNNKTTPIPLFQSPTHQYVVVVKAGSLSLSTPPVPVASGHTNESEIDNRTKIHPYFCSLTHKTSNTLPKYVYPIGQLFYKLASTGAELTETNYAVVVDVVGQDHGMWLVWNRRGFNAEVDEEVVTDPAKEKVLFAAVDASRNFDAVQVVAKIAGWKLGNDGGSLLTLA
ncbi:hypothetical protein B0T21DRAFT_404495, partial [Apiosordaria backusii]